MCLNWVPCTVYLACLMVMSGVALAEHRIGGGAHYWRTLEDIYADGLGIDEDGLAYLGSYQYVVCPYFKIEADLEIFPEDFGGSVDTVFAPQIFGLVGSGFYGGVGVGTMIAGGKFSSDPFFAIRAGLEVELLPRIRLDINANYHFMEFEGIKTVGEDVSTDSVTLGAMLRYVL